MSPSEVHASVKRAQLAHLLHGPIPWTLRIPAQRFEYGRPKQGHGWQPMSNAELVKIMAAQTQKNAKWDCRPLAAELRPLVKLFCTSPENDAYFSRTACKAYMKKTHSITLTVLDAMGMAARATDPASAGRAGYRSSQVKERRNAAKTAGVPFTENCGHGGSSAAHGTSRGGFGATGKGHSGGG